MSKTQRPLSPYAADAVALLVLPDRLAMVRLSLKSLLSLLAGEDRLPLTHEGGDTLGEVLGESAGGEPLGLRLKLSFQSTWSGTSLR